MTVKPQGIRRIHAPTAGYLLVPGEAEKTPEKPIRTCLLKSLLMEWLLWHCFSLYVYLCICISQNPQRPCIERLHWTPSTLQVEVGFKDQRLESKTLKEAHRMLVPAATREELGDTPGCSHSGAWTQGMTAKSGNDVSLLSEAVLRWKKQSP